MYCLIILITKSFFTVHNTTTWQYVVQKRSNHPLQRTRLSLVTHINFEEYLVFLHFSPLPLVHLAPITSAAASPPPRGSDADRIRHHQSSSRSPEPLACSLPACRPSSSLPAGRSGLTHSCATAGLSFPCFARYSGRCQRRGRVTLGLALHRPHPVVVVSNFCMMLFMVVRSIWFAFFLIMCQLELRKF